MTDKQRLDRLVLVVTIMSFFVAFNFLQLVLS